MAPKIKMVKEATEETLEDLKVTLKDKGITHVYIGKSSINFVNGSAMVSPKIYALIKESGIEVE